MKYLLLTSAVGLALLPSYAELPALAQTCSRSASTSEGCSLELISLNRNTMTISDVRTLYVAPFTPDSGGFRSNVIAGLEAWDRFQLVPSRAQADAVVEGAAHSTGHGFWGKISVVSTKDNRVLWSSEATRREGTRDGMAFNQLVSRLRAAVH